MPIPEEILAVKRPKNTRVKAGPKGTYYVIARTCVYKNGRNIPKELGIIGRIIDGKYVPNPESKDEGIDIKKYGTAALFHKVGSSIYEDLLKEFKFDEAQKIYCLALLRACEPEIRNRDIQTEYLCSYLSEMFPNVALSENTLSVFLDDIGKHYGKVLRFMQNRLDNIGKENIVVDGMLKSNTSESNTLSEYSRKARIKGAEDISLIYAYSTVSKEPVACQPYPGNMLDSTSFDDFLEQFVIKDGFMIMDKGFSTKHLREAVTKAGISYVVPLKDNCREISDYCLDSDFDGFVEDMNSNIRYKKVAGDNGKYYYSFHDKKIANDQSDTYINKARKNGTFDENKYAAKLSKFGLIVFESNADLDAQAIYAAYKERWDIEVVFKLYKDILDRDEVNVHGDYRLFASEFINFLSAVLVCRTKKLLAETGLNKTYSYKQILRFLNKAHKIRYTRDGASLWKDNKRLKYIQSVMDSLGI